MSATHVDRILTDAEAAAAMLAIERWRVSKIAAAIDARTSPPSADWIPIADVPGGKKSKRAKARAGQLDAAKFGGRWYVRASSIERLADKSNDAPANDGDDATRASLGLATRGGK